MSSGTEEIQGNRACTPAPLELIISDYLTRPRRPWLVISDSDYITPGGPGEATEYVEECGPAWHGTPGAVEWLTNIISALPANDA